jgi:hypothetical protein
VNPRSNPYKKSRKLPVGALGVKLPWRPLLPDRPPRELEHGEGEFLYMLPLWTGGGHIINLGDGNSATLFALCLKDHNLPGHVTTVDSYDASEKRMRMRDREPLGVLDRITLLNEKTSTARTKITEPASLLFIDADHRHAGVLEDFRLYQDLVQGWLAFHDTNQDDTGRVLREHVDKGWERIFWVNRIQVFRRRA